MNLKNHEQIGMSFIEVIVALFVMGTMLSSLLLMQGTIFSGLVTESSLLGRVFLLEDYLSRRAFAREKNEKEAFKSPKMEKINQPETTIAYTLKKPSKESSLKGLEQLMIEHCSAAWNELAQKQKESMITFLFKPEKQQE
jgi:Tfp pilus assembly protein PilV